MKCLIIESSTVDQIVSFLASNDMNSLIFSNFANTWPAVFLIRHKVFDTLYASIDRLSLGINSLWTLFEGKFKVRDTLYGEKFWTNIGTKFYMELLDGLFCGGMKKEWEREIRKIIGKIMRSFMINRFYINWLISR